MLIRSADDLCFYSFLAFLLFVSDLDKSVTPSTTTMPALIHLVQHHVLHDEQRKNRSRVW